MYIQGQSDNESQFALLIYNNAIVTMKADYFDIKKVSTHALRIMARRQHPNLWCFIIISDIVCY